eukprot:gene197-3363_t
MFYKGDPKSGRLLCDTAGAICTICMKNVNPDQLEKHSGGTAHAQAVAVQAGLDRKLGTHGLTRNDLRRMVGGDPHNLPITRQMLDMQAQLAAHEVDLCAAAAWQQR